VLRRIFGSKRNEVTGGWRKLHNEEHHNLHSLPSIIKVITSRRVRCVGHVARMRREGMHVGYWWESRKENQDVDNIKINLREIGWDGMDWIDLAQDRDQ
jgi:hypothetical protein